MKKTKFLKLFLTFICILAISIVSDKVYGYQLKYKAKATPDLSGALVRTYGNTFGPPEADYIGKWKSQSLDDNGFSYSEQAYRTYEIIFHNALISNYKDGWLNEGINIGYDKSKQTLESSELEASSAHINLKDYIETKKATVTGINDDVYDNSLHFTRGTSDFYNDKYTYRYVSGNDGQTITVSNWYISKNAIDQIKNKWLKDNNSNQIYFSLPAKTGNIYTVNNEGNWYNSYSAAHYIVWYNKAIGNARLGKCK